MRHPHLFAETLGDDVLITTTDDIVILTVHTRDGSKMTRGIELSVQDGKIVVSRDDRPNADSDLLAMFEELFS